MNWFLLLAASAMEVVMAVAFKLAEGWTRPVAGAIGIAACLCSVALLTLALRSIPLGTGYLVWTGIGAAGVMVAGMLIFNEPLSPVRLACAACVLAGTAGLKMGA